jgi:hypothetical protein
MDFLSLAASVVYNIAILLFSDENDDTWNIYANVLRWVLGYCGYAAHVLLSDLS